MRTTAEEFAAEEGLVTEGRTDAEELAAAHPRWADWWRVRDRWDPNGRFLNDHLAAWRR